MKLTTKLTACLVAGNCLVLSGYGLLARQRERAMFERSMERDTYLAGSTLLATVASVWTNRGREAALRLIEQANQHQQDMTFRWLDARALDVTALDAAALSRLGAGERAFERSAGALHMYIPYEPPEGGSGVLEVSQDMRTDEAYLRSSTALLVEAAGVLVGVSALITFCVGSILVGRPIELLVRRLETVGAGKLSERLELRRRDELGVLGRALDTMVADLERAHAEAEAEAAERRATLSQLRHAERLATVGRLAAGVAHELGTPLNVILARARLIERQPAGAVGHAAIIREQAQRMTRIIRHLLGFARRDTSAKADADLAPIIEGVAEALAPLARKRGVTIERDVPADAWVEADRGQLEQVLTNLVMNAIQASPAGGTVRLACRRALGTPPPDHGAPAGSHWLLEVSDEGPGIPEELRERIFEPFFTTKDVGEGTGLGLPVAHGIVAEHDGWIAVDSAPGRGATFRVFLPCRSREEAVCT